MSRDDIVNVKEEKKEFKVGYWYKCIDVISTLEKGKYYKRIGNTKPEAGSGGFWWVDGNECWLYNSRFDVNSESTIWKNSTPPETVNAYNTCVGLDRGENNHQGYSVKEVVTGKPEHTLDNLFVLEYGDEYKIESVNVVKERQPNDVPPRLAVRLTGTFEKQTNDLTKQTEEKQTMSNANRRVVNVKLLDNDSGLPVEYALVAQYQGIVTEDSDAVVINEILLNKNIANDIAKHNEKRVAQTDLEILKRTGNDVKLRQVKLKDLTWIVSPA